MTKEEIIKDYGRVMKEIKGRNGVVAALSYGVGQKFFNLVRAVINESTYRDLGREDISAFVEQIKEVFTHEELEKYFLAPKPDGEMGKIFTKEEQNLWGHLGFSRKDIIKEMQSNSSVRI